MIHQPGAAPQVRITPSPALCRSNGFLIVRGEGCLKVLWLLGQPPINFLLSSGWGLQFVVSGIFG